MSQGIQYFSKTLVFSRKFMPSIYASKMGHILVLFALLMPSLSWAIQNGIVMAEKAFIYADPDRTSPIGFVSRGKKLKLSSISKKQGSVYAVVVSGKIAYISVRDVSTELEEVQGTRLVAERFQEVAKKKSTNSYSVGAYQYSSIITQTESSGPTQDKDSVNWIGATLKGEMELSARTDLQIFLQYMTASEDIESWAMFSLGAGAAYKVVDYSNWQVRLVGEFQLIPFTSYELEDSFRIRGRGISLGGGLDTRLKLSQRWGLEGSVIYQYIKTMGFSAPDTQVYSNPSYMGLRLGANLTYIY